MFYHSSITELENRRRRDDCMKRITTFLVRLKYNFQGGGTVELWDPSSFPGPFISWAHVLIAVFQIINDRLNVLSMISCCYFQFCKNI